MKRRNLIAATAVGAGIAAVAGMKSANADTAPANPAALTQQMRDTQDSRMALYELDRMARDKQMRTMLRQLTNAPALINKKVGLFGDSVTAGYGSVDNFGYMSYLIDLMDRRGYNISIPMHANPGWSVNELKAGLGTFLSANPNLDYALLLIGQNDVAWGMDLTNWMPKYAAIVNQILASNPNVKIACGKIPLSAPNNPTGNANLHVYENAINSWIQWAIDPLLPNSRIAVVDHSNISTQWLLDQGWHPGDAGYLKMAQNWEKQLAKWL